MKKRFKFELINELHNNTILFEYDDNAEDRDRDCLGKRYASSQAFVVLAKTFIKMARCDYKEGFHLHLKKDFDADRSEMIRCVLKK